MKKAIIIGATSFSGIHFTNYLIKKGLEVSAVGRSDLPRACFSPIKSIKKLKFFKVDINKNLKSLIKLIKDLKPDFIINFASQSMVAESWKKPNDWFLTNSYSIPYLYYEISKFRFKNRLVHISTPEVYGGVIGKIKENLNFSPKTPYAVSRTTADYYLNILETYSNIDFVSTRAANVYGEYQSLYRIIPKTIYSILKKKNFDLHGGGISKRSFIHINDVCSATYLLMTSKKLDKNRFYNVSNETIISIENLVKKICLLLDYNFNLLIKKTEERIGKDFIYDLDATRIKKLGWKPTVTLDEGIDRTIIWMKNNINNFSSKDLNYNHKS
jgi:dTDP-glucose 4,6-dehydratase